MPRGGPRPGSGRPRKDGLPIGSPHGKRIRDRRKKKPGEMAVAAETRRDQIAEILGEEVVAAWTDAGGTKVADVPATWPFGTKEASTAPLVAEEDDGLDPATGMPVDLKLEPLEILKRIAQNPRIDIRSRIQAATNAAAYVHAKKTETKADDKAAAAKRASSKFGAVTAPLKLVNRHGEK